MSSITHYDGCWHDPKHHACAVREIERLREGLKKATAVALELTQENERLRRQIDEAAIHVPAHAAIELERLRAEVVEVTRRAGRLVSLLRDLLSEALNSEISDYWYVRVREALGHE